MQASETSTSSHNSSTGSLENPNSLRRNSVHSTHSALLPTRQRYRQHVKHAVPCWRCTAACDKQYGVEAIVYHGALVRRSSYLWAFVHPGILIEPKVGLAAAHI